MPLLVYWTSSVFLFDRSPNVAIYPSGDVIYKQRMGMEKPPRFYHARLTQAQRDDLKHRLRALDSLKPSYFVANGACVPDASASGLASAPEGSLTLAS
ncbi:hypothetical protein, partial [Corallococcus sp. 4LFB]|uniref:hypothetical protein n=1 Tax=Corallococcus sp. 4LFB TaxID=3383249 RepID=UPI003976078A